MNESTSKNDKPVEKSSTSSRPKTSFLGRMFFIYTFRLFLNGYKKGGLSSNDFGACSENDDSRKLCDSLSSAWTTNLAENGKKAKFSSSLIRTFLPSFILPFCFSLFEVSFLLSKMFEIFSEMFLFPGMCDSCHPAVDARNNNSLFFWAK